MARFGRVVDKRPGDQQGILYDTLVNAVRSQIFDRTQFIKGKVTDISTGSDRQTVELSDGSKISTRLVVLATGLNIGVLNKLGIERRVKSAQHSISIGFDAEPVGRPAFAFPALTYYAERPIDRMPYITLFPIGTTMFSWNGVVGGLTGSSKTIPALLIGCALKPFFGISIPALVSNPILSRSRRLKPAAINSPRFLAAVCLSFSLVRFRLEIYAIWNSSYYTWR